MGFAFRQRDGIGAEVRRMATEQIDKAIEDAASGEAFAEVVHRIRRRCKRLRGLLRLIKPHFEDFDRENAAFRDLAASLSGARDKAVTTQTFESLVAYDAGRGGDAELGATLVEQVGTTLRRSVGSELDAAQQASLLAAVRSGMGAARRRATEWTLDGKGYATIADGLEATYRRLRQGLDTARASEAAEDLHAWRKHAKYHWHHVGLFAHAAPDMLAGRKELLDKLGEQLGDHHNLVVLDGTLAGIEGLAAPELAQVRRLIAERQGTLARQAFHLGGQLTAERPGTLRSRFGDYWRLLPREA